ncbi:MAG: hypothetical protein AAGF11_31110 [Myxococcota bacterium]
MVDTDDTSSAASTTGAVDTTNGSSGVGSSTSPSDTDEDTETDGLPDYTDSPCWGSLSNTLVYNGMTHQISETPATCRAEGDHVLLYVMDELWETDVEQTEVNRLMHQLELFSPEGSVNPDQGVILNNEDIFGAMPIDQFPEGKLAIFIVDTAGVGNGYLCGWCDYPQIHMDGVQLEPLDGDFSVSIAAHEAYHVIHRGIDSDETRWVDESLAEAAMTANGFFTDTDWLASFLANPDQNWGPGDPPIGDFNYGGALLWGSFLWERGGIPLMTAITAEPADDWAGLDAALATVGDDADAWSLYLDMIVAVYLDAPELGYGFESFEVPPVAMQSELMAGMVEVGGLYPYGIDYFPIADQGALVIGLSPTTAEPVEGRVVVVGDTVEVVPLEAMTAVEVGPGDTAFVALTARGSAGYELSMD